MAHIFFDLDRTLWDFDRNSKETLQEMYTHFSLANKKISTERFISVYQKINQNFWAAYQRGLIDKNHLRSERFYKTLRSFGYEDGALADRMGGYYIERCPHKTHLTPNALSCLSILAKKHTLHIISNGFAETQDIKLRSQALRDFFKTVTTSDAAGALKPSIKIFDYAWKQAGCPEKSTCYYVGDDWNADVRGATQFGITPIWYSKEYRRSTVLQVSDLGDLPSLLESR